MLGNRGNVLPSPLGIIEIIHAASIDTSTSHRKGVLSITSQQAFASWRSVREEAEAEKKADHFWG